MNTLVWFRRDLRIQDNTALSRAAEAAPAGLLAIYLITPGQWLQHDECPGKVAFWMDNLRALSDELDQRNIPLLVRQVDTFDQVPSTLLEVCRQHQVKHLFFNREYEIHEQRRDEAVLEAVRQDSITVNRCHDRLLLPPGEIRTQSGQPYKVFTPFRKVWDARVAEASALRSTPQRRSQSPTRRDEIPQTIPGFDSQAGWPESYPAGEAAAAQLLDAFLDQIDDYDQRRDLPSVAGTSRLSPYLAAGVISPRQCFQAATDSGRKSLEELSQGARTWVSELAWREFYTHVLVDFPRVCRHQAFKQETEAVAWRDDEEDFQAWARGATGYPIVDAAMRQLNQTGWMHNRLRMVSAMFLTKNLLIDWRRGEQYFMQHLIDGDLAANNGGWQWSASTGTDAVPYFRLFNPFRQSERFDKEGAFIKQMCPELRSLPARTLHDPQRLARAIRAEAIDYPAPIVDYAASRQRALQAFASLND